MTAPGYPYAKSRLTKLISERIAALSGVKDQQTIAWEAGYDRPNNLSMIKAGATRLPLDKVPALAKSLGIDPVFLFRLAVEQHWPALEDSLDKVFGVAHTENAAEILAYINEVSGQPDPALTPKLKQAIADVYERKDIGDVVETVAEQSAANSNKNAAKGKKRDVGGTK